jgi:hypothetical protein
MNTGAKITVTWIRPEGDVSEPATIARTTAAMLPLPANYVPVRFSNGGTILVHASRIAVAA